MFGYGVARHSRKVISSTLALALFCTCISLPVFADAARGLSYRCEFAKSMDTPVSRSACDAVRSAVDQMKGRRPGYGQFVFEVTRARANSLSARLRWKAGGSSGWRSGPVVTTVVSDAALNDDLLKVFARQLVEASGF
jgi:hypothetical protein